MLYFFKPVEGNFCDATFISSSLSGSATNTDEDYEFSNVTLVVMATFGSLLIQVGFV